MRHYFRQRAPADRTKDLCGARPSHNPELNWAEGCTVYSCWGLKAKRPIGEPGNHGAGGDQFTPGRGIRVQVIISLTPRKSQSLLQGAFPIPPGGLSQPAAGADQLGEALHLPRARCVSYLALGTGAAHQRSAGVNSRSWMLFTKKACSEMCGWVCLDRTTLGLVDSVTLPCMAAITRGNWRSLDSLGLPSPDQPSAW